MSRRTLIWLGISWLTLAIGFVLGRLDCKHEARKEAIEQLKEYSQSILICATVLEIGDDTAKDLQSRYLQQKLIPSIQQRLEPYAEDESVQWEIELNRRFFEKVAAKNKKN